jgi:GT2 family glycosyltransferase/spore maturation protein CgeB
LNHLWKDVIKPLLELTNSKKIVEVGAQKGLNTKNILEYVQEKNGVLYSIDPAPQFDVEAWQQECRNHFVYYKELSLSALPLIEDYDAILIDGDHNWYTVYNELKIIEKSFQGKEKFPLIFTHDVNWPYARRDLYYNPDNIPLAYQQPYKKSGLLPGSLKLIDEGGLNSHLNNAIYENNPQNGVLTAIEDFLNETNVHLAFVTVEGFHGLGVIYLNNEENKEINSILKSPKLYTQMIRNLEGERLKKHIEIDRLGTKLKETQQLKERMCALEDTVSDKKKQIVLLNNEIYTIRTELDKTIEEKNEVTQKLQLVEDAKQELKNIVKRLEDRYEKELVNNKLLGEELNDKKNMIGSTRVKLREVEISNDNASQDNTRLRSSLDETKKRLQQAEFAANVHLNSIKYRLGDILISSLRPSRKTLLAPFKIYKLFKEGLRKGKKKPRVVINSELLNEKDATEKIYEGIIREHEDSIDIKVNSNCPLVSFLILNRNGAIHLQRLFKAIEKNTLYPNFEIILIDNNSNDNSIQVIQEYSERLSIKLIRNSYNASFSEANNLAARKASGEYLLLLNNDVEPLKGWLSEMVSSIQHSRNIGSVGAKLIYSKQHGSSINKKFEFKVQHTGIAFQTEKEFIQPFNTGKGLDPFDPLTNVKGEKAAITAACLLVRKDVYFQVGGLDEEYIYGYEDVDFGLKLRAAGYKNIYCPTSVLFHHEFGSQEKDNRKDVRERRLKNRERLKKKWYTWLKYNLLLDKLDNKFVFSESPLKIALAVTESGANVSAGDYFTALELGYSLEKLGFEVYYVSRRGKQSWYELRDGTDVLISLLEAYDPTKIKREHQNVTKIAWMRNWFDRWIESPGFEAYDILMASSKIACEFVAERTNRKVHLLSIGTNPERFNKGKFDKGLACDYCFTGSYWNDPREIIDMLFPAKLPYEFGLYGENWNKIEKLRDYHKGFIKYETIPNLYKSTKIVIDDANRVTKPYGSVNSRVFDAIASGALVLTNGYLGSQETFNGQLPTYSNSEELEQLLLYYLSDEDKREKKINELKDIVLKNHTYDHRAKEFKNILISNSEKNKIAIKVPAPKWETVHEWGDYHMALGLQREFEKQGHQVIIQILPEWNNGEDTTCDIVIVLRGLSKYKPKANHFNIMWNISHPDKVTIDEYNQYNYVFISSLKWAEKIDKQTNVPVKPMLQCTDINLFRKYESDEFKHQLLFVGNSRKVYRKIIKDLMTAQKEIASSIENTGVESERDLSIYGTLWENIVADKYIRGSHIPNNELYKYYSSSDILLNDHWEDMKEKGFISNRIFDGLAAEAFIISDKVVGLEEIIGDSVVTYETPEELLKLVDYYLTNPDVRKEKTRKGAEIVRKEHTFKNRVEQILKVLNKR